MSKFVVGEIATVRFGPAKGLECEILEVNPINTEGEVQDYRVEINGFPHFLGMGWCCSTGTLRKKKPPKEEFGSWKEVQKITEGWNPTKEKVNV